MTIARPPSRRLRRSAATTPPTYTRLRSPSRKLRVTLADQIADANVHAERATTAASTTISRGRRLGSLPRASTTTPTAQSPTAAQPHVVGKKPPLSAAKPATAANETAAAAISSITARDGRPVLSVLDARVRAEFSVELGVDVGFESLRYTRRPRTL